MPQPPPDPFDAPLIRLGLAFAASGSMPEAIATYRKALEEPPAAAAAHTLLGGVACTEGRWEEAIRHGVAAHELAPELPEPLCNLGVAYWFSADPRSALRCWEHALALRYRAFEAMLNLGVSHLHFQHGHEARTTFERALCLAPASADASNNLGVAMALAGQDRDGMSCMQRAVARDSRHRPALENLARLFDLRHQHSEAERCRNLAAAGRPSLAVPLGPWRAVLKVAGAPHGHAAGTPPSDELKVYVLDEPDT